MHLLLAQPAVPLFQFLSLLACMAAGANLEGTWWLVGLHLWLEPPIDVYERIAEELEGMPQYIARRRWMEEASSYAMGVGPLSRLSSGRMRGWVCRVWIDGYWHAQIPWLPVFGGARMRAFRRQLEAASAAMSAVAEASAVDDFFAADEDFFAEERLGSTAPPADAASAVVEARPVEEAATT